MPPSSVYVQELLTTFQTVFVGVATLAMVAAFCFLWRDQPAKIAAVTIILPNCLLALFMDAYPESGRPMASRVYFVGAFLMLALLQVARAIYMCACACACACMRVCIHIYAYVYICT